MSSPAASSSLLVALIGKGAAPQKVGCRISRAELWILARQQQQKRQWFSSRSGSNRKNKATTTTTPPRRKPRVLKSQTPSVSPTTKDRLRFPLLHTATHKSSSRNSTLFPSTPSSILLSERFETRLTFARDGLAKLWRTATTGSPELSSTGSSRPSRIELQMDANWWFWNLLLAASPAVLLAVYCEFRGKPQMHAYNTALEEQQQAQQQQVNGTSTTAITPTTPKSAIRQRNANYSNNTKEEEESADSFSFGALYRHSLSRLWHAVVGGDAHVDALSVTTTPISNQQPPEPSSPSPEQPSQQELQELQCRVQALEHQLLLAQETSIVLPNQTISSSSSSMAPLPTTPDKSVLPNKEPLDHNMNSTMTTTTRSIPRILEQARAKATEWMGRKKQPENQSPTPESSPSAPPAPICIKIVEDEQVRVAEAATRVAMQEETTPSSGVAANAAVEQDTTAPTIKHSWWNWRRS
jgi:hypothetical protein